MPERVAEASGVGAEVEVPSGLIALMAARHGSSSTSTLVASHRDEHHYCPSADTQHVARPVLVVAVAGQRGDALRRPAPPSAPARVRSGTPPSMHATWSHPSGVEGRIPSRTEAAGENLPSAQPSPSASRNAHRSPRCGPTGTSPLGASASQRPPGWPKPLVPRASRAAPPSAASGGRLTRRAGLDADGVWNAREPRRRAGPAGRRRDNGTRARRATQGRQASRRRAVVRDGARASARGSAST